jgi:hypothetical protein
MVKFWIKILPNYFYKKITDQEFTITYYCLVGYLKLEDRTSGVMVCMLDSSAVDCGFKPCSGQNRL